MPKTTQPQSTQTTRKRIHESGGENVRILATAGVALAFMVILSIIAAGVMDHSWGGGRSTENIHTVVPPEPRLQVTPLIDITRMRRRQEEQLNGYGWIDRDKGIVHIPIQSAMNLLVRKGQQGNGDTQDTQTPATPTPSGNNQGGQ